MKEKKSTEIRVRQVGNGYMVSTGRDDYCATPDSATLVFESMIGLKTFITGHFDYRGKNIKSDK